MGMTAGQTAAFTAASGHLDIPLLHLACVGFLVAVLFLWAAWALADVWNGWANEKVRHAPLVRFAIRAVLLIVVSIWMFAN